MCASLGCYRWCTFLRKGKKSVVWGRESEHPATKMANAEIQYRVPVAVCSYVLGSVVSDSLRPHEL